jgi:hypothetical protein
MPDAMGITATVPPNPSVENKAENSEKAAQMKNPVRCEAPERKTSLLRQSPEMQNEPAPTI